MSLTFRLYRWLEQRAKKYAIGHPRDPVVAEWLASGDSVAGVSITERNAQAVSSVYAAVQLLSRSQAMLPWITYKRMRKGKRRATEHPVYRLLHTAPNPFMTSFTFRRVLMEHVLLWGNAYAEIQRSGSGEPAALWPLLPDRTEPKLRDDGSLVYETRGNDETVTIPADDVFHVVGQSFDGLKGRSVISHARESLGLAAAAELSGASMFGNSSILGLALTHPNTLSEPAQKRLKASVEEAHRGPSKAFRLMVLEEAMKVESIGIPPKDAQFLETRQFQVAEVARWFGLQPHMIADLTKSSFSNITQQSLEYVIYGLDPWLVCWEQAANWKLFRQDEQDKFFTEFLVDALLRGDMQARFTAYKEAISWGWMNVDEVRERENMNHLPDNLGEIYLVPENYTNRKALAQEQPVEPADDDEPAALPVAATKPNGSEADQKGGV